jgi:hypothetical protein
MKTFFAKGVLGLSVILMSAVPSFGTTILSMTNTANGGTITTSNGTVTALSGIPLNTLNIVGGATYTLSNTVETLSGLILTVTGAVYNGATPLAGAGTTASPVTLFTITFASALANFNGASSTSLNVPFVGSGAPVITSVTANSSLLTDLGLTGYVPTVGGGGVIGSGTVTGGNGTYSSTSNTLSIGLNAPAPTPEPASMFLMGSGLLAGVMIVRRRKAAATA